jgi:hypothetical protein
MAERPSVVKREGGAETTGMVPMVPGVMEPTTAPEGQGKSMSMVKGSLREQELRMAERSLGEHQALGMEEMVVVEARPNARLEMEARPCKRPHRQARASTRTLRAVMRVRLRLVHRMAGPPLPEGGWPRLTVSLCTSS